MQLTKRDFLRHFPGLAALSAISIPQFPQFQRRSEPEYDFGDVLLCRYLVDDEMLGNPRPFWEYYAQLINVIYQRGEHHYYFGDITWRYDSKKNCIRMHKLGYVDLEGLEKEYEHYSCSTQRTQIIRKLSNPIKFSQVPELAYMLSGGCHWMTEAESLAIFGKEVAA